MSIGKFFFGDVEVCDSNEPIVIMLTKNQIKQQNKLLLDLFDEFNLNPFDFVVDYENVTITLYFENTPENLSNIKFTQFLFNKTIKSMKTLEKSLIKSTNKE